MTRHYIAAGALALAGFTPVSAVALDIDDSTSALNDRFANDPTFIMNDYDLSGVGRSSDGKWATLVSQNVFLSANHFHPGVASTVTFYQTNNPAGSSITRSVTSGQRIGTSDLWVGVLNEPLPVGYAVYEFATETITDTAEFNASVYNAANTEAYMVGQSPFNAFSGNQNFAVGRNVLDGWADNVSGTGHDAILAAIEDEAQDITYEATLVGGDSGAPLFVDLDGTDTNYDLRLTGTNWFVGPVGPSSPLDSNGFAYVGNYDTQIQTFIDSHPVPEPSALAMLLLAGLSLTTRQRR